MSGTSSNGYAARLGRSLRTYFLGGDTLAADGPSADAEDQGLWETGGELIDRVVEAIRTRRSVLLTGPRGSGKSHCAKWGIVKAWKQVNPPLIGGYRFLQGNREIPRDLLSEDMLVLDDAGMPVLLRALAMRPLDEDVAVSDRVRERRKKHKLFPAIRSRDVGGDYDAAHALWQNEDWTVLYLDEINRFADGFLDSLLSLTEERIVVRRGEDYFVPIIVVATANPPGYDATAKKLSPPLQARISRSYRVSQPSLNVLAGTIVRDKLPAITGEYPQGRRYPPDGHLVWLASAATLCLWGDPRSKANRGAAYLSRSTKQLLEQLMDRDPDLAAAMRQLSGLIIFGPDSRAILDWLACAIGRAHAFGRMLASEDLESTAVEVLGHKVRESFNEGAEPDRLLQRDGCIRRIAGRILTNARLRDLLINDLRAAAAVFRPDAGSIAAAEEDLQKLLAPLSPERRAIWLQALVAVEGLAFLGAEALRSRWEPAARQLGALVGEEEFRNEQERRSISEIFTRLHSEREFGLGMLEWPVSRTGQFETLLPSRSESLRQFESELRPMLHRHPRLLGTEAGQQAWLDLLEDLVAPEDMTVSALRGLGWQLLASHYTPDAVGPPEPEDLIEMARDSIQSIEAVSNRVGRARTRKTLELLGRLDEVPFARAAEHLAVAVEATEGPIRAELVRHAFALQAELERRGQDGTNRAKAWLEYLSRAARGKSTKLGTAEECPEAPGRFRDGFERDWVLGLIRKLNPKEKTPLAASAEALSSTRVSPAPMLPGRDTAPLLVRNVFLDTLRPRKSDSGAAPPTFVDVEIPLFDDYGKPRREAAQELRRLFIVMARSFPGDPAELLGESIRSAANLSSGDDFSSRLPHAIAFLTGLLRNWGAVKPDTSAAVEKATTELQKFEAGPVVKATIYVTARDDDAAVVGRNASRLLQKFSNLSRRLTAARPDDLSRVAAWLNALAALGEGNVTDDASMTRILREKQLLGDRGFALLEERVWLHELAEAAGHKPLVQLTEHRPLDAAAIADRLVTPSDSAKAHDFLFQVIELLGSSLKAGDSRLLSGLLAFYREYWALPEGQRDAAAHREAQRLARGAEAEIGPVATALTTALRRVGGP